METIQFNDLVGGGKGRTWLSHAIMYLIGDQRKFKEIIADESVKSVDIEIKFNGVEVSFTSFIKHLETSFDVMLAEAARKLVKERLGDSIEKIQTTMSELERHIEDTIANKLGIPKEDRW